MQVVVKAIKKVSFELLHNLLVNVDSLLREEDELVCKHA